MKKEIALEKWQRGSLETVCPLQNVSSRQEAYVSTVEGPTQGTYWLQFFNN